jgi:signal transduction histidine kinase
MSPPPPNFYHLQEGNNLSFYDNGYGIQHSEDKLFELSFESFSRFRRNKSKYGGTGLGFNTTKNY